MYGQKTDAQTGVALYWQRVLWQFCLQFFQLSGIIRTKNVYFNIFAGSNLNSEFELDYWGLSFKQGIEKVLEKHPVDTLALCFSLYPGYYNVPFLPEELRNRVNADVSLQDADYFISNYRGVYNDARYKNKRYPYINRVDSIMVGNARIIGIYDPNIGLRKDLIK